MKGPSAETLKRGHHRDFALTAADKSRLMNSVRTTSLTRQILQMLYDGAEVRDIAASLGISTVAVWRRCRKAILRAADLGIINVDPDHIPFPEALRLVKPESLHIREEIISLAKRVHVLNGGAFDLRDPLLNCPHLDCHAVRSLLEAYDKERKKL